VIQGGCGEVIKKKMYEVKCFLDEGHYKTKMINNVHDEITTMHPIERRELEIIPVINKLLQDLPFRVPITWGIEWGYRWGTKKDFTTLEDLYKELGI
jgi:DNA polymerase I-like protein with 3'-5' exonuclease and polymerase domains